MRWWIIAIVCVLVVAVFGGGFFLTRSKNTDQDIRTLAVTPQTVIQDVAFTGRLNAVTSSDISFELPGTVTAVLVKEGDFVEQNQPLVSLDTSNANLEFAYASANAASAQDSKKVALNQASQTLTFTLAVNEETLAKRQQAVRDAKRELDQAKQVHQQRAAESGDTAAATESTIATIRAAETMYHTAQQTLTETKASIAQENAAAQAAVETARVNYLATTQTTRGVSGLSSVDATKALAAKKISKHTLIAPFSGTVTAVHRQVGEAALAGSAVITLATTDQIEVSADATETDAIKLALGMPATITFDAIPTTQDWRGEVTYLAPAATVIEGIPTYTIKLHLTGETQLLKPGLSANITVHAAQKDTVLAIPRRAITVRDKQEFVFIISKTGSIHEKEITTGLIGSNGSVEVTSGLSPNELIIVNPSQLEEKQ